MFMIGLSWIGQNKIISSSWLSWMAVLPEDPEFCAPAFCVGRRHVQKQNPCHRPRTWKNQLISTISYCTCYTDLLKWSFSSVLPFVCLKWSLVPQHLPTITALELGLFVSGHVGPEACYSFRTLPTIRALVFIVGRVVDYVVLPELVLIWECYTADRACRGYYFAFVDCIHMKSQLSWGCEFLWTPITINI